MHNQSQVAILAACCSALVSACAAARPSIGQVVLWPKLPGSTPIELSVEKGRIFGAGLDLTADPQGCLSGGSDFDKLALCKKIGVEPASAPGARAESWTGPSGTLVVEVSPAQDALLVEGQLLLHGRLRPVQRTMQLGNGPQWDEVRRNPVLLATAVVLAGSQTHATRVAPGNDGPPAPPTPTFDYKTFDSARR